jgi:hypothetical protein
MMTKVNETTTGGGKYKDMNYVTVAGPRLSPTAACVRGRNK